MITPAVDFQLEILQSCALNCPACHVDKERATSASAPTFQRLSKLFHEFQDKQYSLDHLIVGPVDFAASKNFSALMQSEEFLSLTSMFDTTNWTTTLLDSSWQEKVRVLSEKNRSEWTTFSFVLHPQKAMDEGYLEFFVKRARQLTEIYGRPIRRFYILFNAYPHGPDEKIDFAKDYSKVHHSIIDHFDVPTFDHGLSFTRTDSIERDRKRILEHMNWLNQIYDEVAHDTDVPIEFLNVNDYTANRYVYRNKEFFWAPLWYEPFICFDEAVRIPTHEWKVEEFEKFEKDMVMRQYSSLPGSVCEPCPHNSTCLRRGMIELKNILGEEGCIAPKRAIDTRGFIHA